jgi:hypothetical protein
VNVITIVFVDDGQDFLEWDIDGEGKVVDCRPFQAWLWVGMVVQNKTIRTGDHITYKAKDGARHTLVHAVENVKQIA